MSNEQQREQDLATLLSEMTHQYQNDPPPAPTPVYADDALSFQLPEIPVAEIPVTEIPAPDWGKPTNLNMPSSADLQDLDSLELPPLPAAKAVEANATPEPPPAKAVISVAPSSPATTTLESAPVTVTVSAAPVEPAPAPVAAQPIAAASPTAPSETTPVQPAAAPTSSPAAAAVATASVAAAASPAIAQTDVPKTTGLLRERAQLHPLLEKMADESLKRGASDIFISSNFPPSFKIDGTLIPVPLKPLTPEEAAQIVYSTFNDEQKAVFPDALELNYSLQSKNGLRFRVNAYHEQGRIGLVMRRITTDILTVDDLQLPQSLKTLAMRKRGLIILAGATGSGKSTSQAAMLDWRNKHSAGHIVTIEDPIEYIHSPNKSIITQREVGLDTHSWGAAVQSAMRQAPDVVVVGEVRNEQSMEYALQLAQTGHLCFFTIHATNASQTIERIMNLYPEERHPQILMDLALNLVAIIGQRLVLKKGGKGRTAIVDLLINTPAMQDHVFKNELLEARDLMERAADDGMQTFDQDLFRLYVNGEIDYDEALRQAESANDLRLRIKLYEEGQESTHIFERVGDLNLM